MHKKIVVLEDEAVLVDLLHNLLDLEGYEVSKLKSPDNVLDELRSTRPDAILMDVNLKGANGLELLGKIRADEDLKDILVVLSSGMDYRQESLARGADDFLMKPYMPDDLMKILKQKIKD
ncbi:MAG TPA: response regulator [Anaerolineales bacterium]|nr:response regulator [Anaerolineales bacterium]